MQKWQLTSLFIKIFSSLPIILSISILSLPVNDLSLAKTATGSPSKEETYRLVSGRRAVACPPSVYHQNGSLRQVVNAYRIAYAKYNLKPVTIEYRLRNSSAKIQYLGKLKNTGSRFQILTSLSVGASSNNRSSAIIPCHLITPFPDTGNNDRLSAEDWEELTSWQQTIERIQILVSQKYPIQ
jgi:hypothetical protein